MILILKYFLYNAVLLLILKQMKKSEINHVLLKCVALLQTNHMVVCYLYLSLGNLQLFGKSTEPRLREKRKQTSTWGDFQVFKALIRMCLQKFSEFPVYIFLGILGFFLNNIQQKHYRLKFQQTSSAEYLTLSLNFVGFLKVLLLHIENQHICQNANVFNLMLICIFVKTQL